MLKRMAALALSVLMLCALASADVSVMVEVRFGQTEARSMLEMINAFRTGDDAWYWNSDNTEKVYLTDLEPLVWDAGLERAAMQRAVEISLHFDHTRTDGTSCFAVWDELGLSTWAAGENIAAGYGTASAAFIGWQETDCDHSGQGHRRNMLSGGSVAVGIGHVVRNSCHYWVQEFAFNAAETDAGEADDTTRRASVNVSDSQVSSFSVTGLDASDILLEYGTSAGLPQAECSLLMSSAWPSAAATVWAAPAWTSADPLCAAVDGTAVTGRAVGTTELTAALAEKTYTLPVQVVFSDRMAADFVLPDTLDTLEAEALSGTGVKALVIPEGVTALGSRAFAACPALRQITFNNDGIAIADDAFASCPEGLILLCREGSTAEGFALEKGLDIVRFR